MSCPSADRAARIHAALLVVLAGTLSAASAQEPSTVRGGSGPLQRQREIQERARGLAVELVSGVLDGQLRQLEENGLGELPVYADIQAMRGNIEGLVQNEMQEIVALLVKAESAGGPERTAAIQSAQQMVRRIAVQLAAERRQLLRRMKIADIAAQARRLIKLQASVLETTTSLPAQAGPQLESATLTTLEQQRTVKSLFAELAATLEDVRKWDGEEGAAATESLRNVKDARVPEALVTAEERLGALDFDTSMGAQRAVLTGLGRLLGSVERVTAAAADRDGSAAAVAGLIEQARQLREEIASSTMDEKSIEELVAKLSEFRGGLGDLAESLRQRPEAAPLAEQARAAVEESLKEVFDGDQRDALAQQDRAVGALEQLAERLGAAAIGDTDRRSADELARRLSDLQEARRQLAEVAAARQAVPRAAADPRAAAAAERRVAEALPRIAAGKDLPRPVTTRLDEAAGTAAEAEQNLAAAAADPGRVSQAEQAARDSAEAFDRAQRELANAVADTERMQLASKVGELTRAAEAIERAAAAEREVARQVAADPAAARDVAGQQRDVGQVAEQVAQAVAATAPQSADELAGAREAVAAAEAGIDALSGQNEPGQQQAAQAAAQAEQAAAGLEQAAAALRREAADAAQQLAQAAQSQLDALASAQSEPGLEPQIAARQGQIERDRGLAEAIADRFAGQEEARAAIGRLSEQLAAQGQQQSGQQQSGQQQSGQQQSGQQQSGQQQSGQQQSGQQQSGQQQSGQQQSGQQQSGQQQSGQQQSGQQQSGQQQSGQPSADGRALAEALQEAQEAFADAQRATGSDVAAITGQTEIENQLLRDALESASQLGQQGQQGQGQQGEGQQGEGQQGEGQQGEGQQGQGQQGQGQQGQGQQGQGQQGQGQQGQGQGQQGQGQQGQGQQGQGQQGQGQQGQGQQGQGQQGQGQQGQGQQGQGQGQQLGTGFIPSSPEATARMIAGQQAQQMADAMLASGESSSSSQSEGQGQSQSKQGSQKAGKGQKSKSVGGGGSGGNRSGDAEDGPPEELQPSDGVGKEAAGASGQRQGDVAFEPKPVEQEGWFARLPPETRQAIRAKSQRRAPRGYEEKLGRYFKNIDE